MTAGIDTLIKTKTTAEVTNISPNGLWILSNGEEYFISYEDYPAFVTASIRQISDVTADCAGNLHWQELDIDIELESLKTPEKYPLVYR